MLSMYFPVAAYGFEATIPPSPYCHMPSVFGSSTHSTAST